MEPISLALPRYDTQIRMSRDTVSIRRFRYARNHREGCDTQFDTPYVWLDTQLLKNQYKKKFDTHYERFDTHSIRNQVFHKRLQSVTIVLYFPIVRVTQGMNIWFSGSPINWISECGSLGDCIFESPGQPETEYCSRLVTRRLHIWDYLSLRVTQGLNFQVSGPPTDWILESPSHQGTDIRVYGSPSDWIFESRVTWKLDIVLLWTSWDLICGKFGSCSIRRQYAADTLSRHSKQCFQEQWVRNKRMCTPLAAKPATKIKPSHHL
jgi:hypothetical protein